MPLPLFLGLGAAAAGAVGAKNAVKGAKNITSAKKTKESAEFYNKRNISRFEENNRLTLMAMDQLGELELEIMKDFKEFADLFEKIKNRPVFKNEVNEKVELPEYDGEELRKISIGAQTLLGGLGGAALGSAGGIAAAGATTSAVMALGTASTGTAIAGLSGAAATNATLAAIGGGAIAAGGGGVALGTAILGAATLGVGILVGGTIINATGKNLSEKADEAYAQMLENEQEINKICTYLGTLRVASREYLKDLNTVRDLYAKKMATLQWIVEDNKKTNWNEFTDAEKLLTKNLVMLVGLLHKMCQLKLVLRIEQEKGEEINEVNTEGIKATRELFKKTMASLQ